MARAMQSAFQPPRVAGMRIACAKFNPYRGTNRMHQRRLAMLTLAALPVARLAFAAPYCVQTEAIPAQCLYYDAASCNARAKQMQGYCSVNTAELNIAP